MISAENKHEMLANQRSYIPTGTRCIFTYIQKHFRIVTKQLVTGKL